MTEPRWRDPAAPTGLEPEDEGGKGFGRRLLSVVVVLVLAVVLAMGLLPLLGKL